jgi:hypothetical protein
MWGLFWTPFWCWGGGRLGLLLQRVIPPSLQTTPPFNLPTHHTTQPRTTGRHHQPAHHQGGGRTLPPPRAHRRLHMGWWGPRWRPAPRADPRCVLLRLFWLGLFWGGGVVGGRGWGVPFLPFFFSLSSFFPLFLTPTHQHPLTHNGIQERAGRPSPPCASISGGPTPSTPTTTAVPLSSSPPARSATPSTSGVSECVCV